MGDDPTPRQGASTPVMVRISPDMRAELAAIARREESSVAAVMRRLTRERLEQLRKEAGTS